MPRLFYYICPDCQQDIEAGETWHEHDNGERIYTEDIRRFYQWERWLTKKSIASMKSVFGQGESQQ